MSEIEHNKNCKYEERKKEFDAWRTEHPCHCQKCMGWGWVFYDYDPSPAGVSLSSGSMQDCDPCECIENDICPVCGQLGLQWRNDDMNCKCDACDYDDEHPEKTAPPSEPECYCWETARYIEYDL